MPLSIDVGYPAVYGYYYYIANQRTFVSHGNPANRSGKITQVKIYAHTSMTNCQVATIREVSNNVFTTRDTHTIGNVAAGATRTFSGLDISIQAGDFIAIYFASGQICLTEPRPGNKHKDGDKIPCTDETFIVNVDSTRAMAFYATGTTIAPTVTTQAVTEIGGYVGTGNGNITDTGGENATKRGFCWNTTGSPTVADNKVEETGSFGVGAFTGAITGLDPGVKYYVKAYAYNSSGYSYGAEVDFTTDKVAPTVTVQAPSDVLPTTVTANGNITALGGENSTIRGFKYGLTKTDTWDSHEDGDYGLGAYTRDLVDLAANTTYWIQAYAVNTIGTSYSAWISFQTAAEGTIPTGTLINICSDYSAFTYQLQRSETDDGDPYTAYFVINTDLANKKGLTYYKRILDLYLYFRCEASGTAEIYVKRDNEAEWQYLDSVGLTDVTEPTIVIKHLAVDVKAKTYDFKVSFANACRFIGVVFEFIPGGAR